MAAEYLCEMNSLFEAFDFKVNNITISGVKIDRNSHQNIILIHGLSNASLVWKPLIQSIDLTYNIYAIDLPGCGLSEYSNETYSKDFYIGIIHELINNFQLKDNIIIGHSMGGQIATHFAVKYPNLTSHLVLIAPSGFERYYYHEIQLFKMGMSSMNMLGNSTMYLSQALHQSFYQLKDEYKSMIQNLLNLYRHTDSTLYQKMIGESIEYMCSNPLLDHHIQIPTLVVFGQNDELIPNRILHPQLTVNQIIQEVKSCFNQVTIQSIPHSGHFVHVEHPVEIAKTIKTFVLS